MLDIGFWELAIIAVVALVVIGPERLPGVARTTGMWVGKARKMILSVKADVERELKAEELKRILDEQAKSVGVDEIIEDTKSIAEDLKQEDYLLKAVTGDKPANTEQAAEPSNRDTAEPKLPATDDGKQ